MVHKILAFEQQETRENGCIDTFNVIENDILKKKTITCDKPSFFSYDPEMKHQSKHWKSPSSHNAKKARNFKAMMIVSFDIYGIVNLCWIPEEQTINQHYYLHVLPIFRERIRGKRPNCGGTRHGSFTKTRRRLIPHCLSRAKPVDFHDAKNQQCPCGIIIRHGKDLFGLEAFGKIKFLVRFRIIRVQVPLSDSRLNRFDEWAQNEIAVVPNFHKRILFTDEAHFWLNGYVNKQSCCIWSEANPQVYVETPLHPEKLTVWCALWAGGPLIQKR
ncbi:putative mariner transposase [Trichonephila clavipes]|nr:putative mariner transposase [Trichonephila clavipes]